MDSVFRLFNRPQRRQLAAGSSDTHPLPLAHGLEAGHLPSATAHSSFDDPSLATPTSIDACRHDYQKADWYRQLTAPRASFSAKFWRPIRSLYIEGEPQPYIVSKAMICGTFSEVALVRHGSEELALRTVYLKRPNFYSQSNIERRIELTAGTDSGQVQRMDPAEFAAELLSMQASDSPLMPSILASTGNWDVRCLIARYEVDLSQYTRRRMALPPSASNSHEQSIETLQLMADVFGRLDKLHAKGFIHNDLKPENVLVGQHGFEICDFGLTQRMRDVLHSNEGRRGTYVYQPPERVWVGAPVDARYDARAIDIFGAGLVVLESMSGDMFDQMQGVNTTEFSQRIAGGLHSWLADGAPTRTDQELTSKYGYGATMGRRARLFGNDDILHILARSLDPNWTKRPLAAETLQHIQAAQRAAYLSLLSSDNAATLQQVVQRRIAETLAANSKANNTANPLQRAKDELATFAGRETSATVRAAN